MVNYMDFCLLLDSADLKKKKKRNVRNGYTT